MIGYAVAINVSALILHRIPNWMDWFWRVPYAFWSIKTLCILSIFVIVAYIIRSIWKSGMNHAKVLASRDKSSK